MKANSSIELNDWPISSADHKIEPSKALEMINSYSKDGYGAFFTLNTINGLLSQASAGIRYYFTIYNKQVTVLITGVEKSDNSGCNDLYTSKLAISSGLEVVPAGNDQSISLEQAALCNRNYRLSTHFKDGRKGGMFGIEAFQSLAKQPGCTGIRFYFGKDISGNKTIVLFGVNASGQNILNYVADQNAPCPNYCSTSNPLNS